MTVQFVLYSRMVESTQTGYPTKYIPDHNVSNKELTHKIRQLERSQNATPAKKQESWGHVLQCV
jgi:hypothetical protein